jgi:methionine synthase II (cobalamin-independent)
MSTERELDQIQKDIETLHERTQLTKSEFATHEAVCAARYEKIMENFERLQEQIQYTFEEVQDLKNLATQGKSSLKTLVFIGMFIAGLVGFIYTALSIFR